MRFMSAHWPPIYFANCFVVPRKQFFRRKFSENRKAVYSVNFNMPLPTVPDSRFGNSTDHGLYTVSAHTFIHACECACIFAALAHRMTEYTYMSSFVRLSTYVPPRSIACMQMQTCKRKPR